MKNPINVIYKRIQKRRERQKRQKLVTKPSVNPMCYDS